MSDIIALLPDTIANQIAAGEVIQRPASAVKEMMENAIDAGASTIQLIIKDAGKTLIQVIDNGKGMSETDARMCFERHATSKIKKIEDLFSIRTKGFRGEAMASIAAVAQVELKSRTEGFELGTKLIIEGSKVKSQEACQSPVGTSIAVKNLFFNVPARRNFLKSNPVETKHIIDEFQRIAISYPDVFFTMHNNGQQVYHLPAGNLRKRLAHILGAKYDERLIPVDEETPHVKIFGFIGKPEFARKTRGEQFFFVNQRFIRSPYLNHSLLTAYEDLLQKDTHPLYVLFLEIDPARIDVNVHPTKQEIKFEDERLIYTVLHASIKRGLGIYSINPTIDFDADTSLGMSFDLTEKKDSGGVNPTNTIGANTGGYTKENVPENWQSLFSITEKLEGQDTELRLSSGMNDDSDSLKDELIDIKPFQLHSQYIIFQIKSGFILIDQRSASQRILYERFLAAFEDQEISKQKLLFPQTIELKADEAELLISIMPEVNALGYEIENFGGHSFIIRAVPADIEENSTRRVIEEFLDQCKLDQKELQLNPRNEVARHLGVSMAIKKGHRLSKEEMASLIDQLFACETPYLSPAGKPTFITYSLQDLEKQFQKRN